MLDNIISNVVAGIICAVLAYLSRKIVVFLSAPPQSQREGVPYSKRSIHTQFLVYLFTLVICLSAGVLIVPNVMWIALLKIFLLLAAGFSFIFLWGAFDAALAFYPDDNARDDKPSDKPPDDTGKE